MLAFQRQLAGSEAELEGMLRLSSSDWFGSFMLAPVLAEFSRRHPRVCVELLTDARLYSLPRREADLVFRIRPFDEPEVISRRLMHIPYALYCAREPRHRSTWRRGRPARGHHGHRVRRDARRDLAQAGAAERDRRGRSNNREVQARLCAGGAGLAVLPRPLGDATPGIVALAWTSRRRGATPSSATTGT